VALPDNVDVVRVRGYWFSQSGGGSGLSVTFTPSVANLIDISEHAYIKTAVKVATPDDATAYFFADLIATNDPDLTPSPARWRVTRDGFDPVVIEVPYDLDVVDVGDGLMMHALWLTDATVVG
jgi:hypothetical protein